VLACFTALMMPMLLLQNKYSTLRCLAIGQYGIRDGRQLHTMVDFLERTKQSGALMKINGSFTMWKKISQNATT
jgi:hypothetical protein